jgi:IMP dehydrogenase
MLGSLLSGTKEAPGEMITKVTERGDKQHFKVYRGMASDSAREDRGKAYNDQYSYVPAAEGVKTLVPYKGTAHSIIMQLKKGLKSGMSYCNATKVDEIKDCALFELQTSSGFNEGKPHILG